VALLEFAFVAPVILALFAMVIDFGFAWRKTMAMSAAIRGGVRVVTNLGDERNADRQALLALNASIAEIGSANITRVIVYHSLTATGEVSSQCLALAPQVGTSGSGVGRTGECNVYGKDQLAAMTPARFTDSTGTGCDGSDWDRFYCPVARESQQAVGSDFVGVFVEYSIDHIVGFISDGVTTDDQAIMRIEPQADST
jgi:hypothetical protein